MASPPTLNKRRVRFKNWPGEDGPTEVEVDADLYDRAEADAARRGITMEQWWNEAITKQIDLVKLVNRPGWDKLPPLRSLSDLTET